MFRLAYNDELHEYRLDGAIVPSVTQILKPISSFEYLGVSAEVMDKAASLGKAVHKVIELDCKGTLDIEGMPDELVPWYSAWLNFRALSGVEIIGSEERVFSDRYRYAGTLDLSVRLNGRLCLIDAKRTAAIPRSVGPQLAGYEQGYREKHDIAATEPIDRYALHLMPDGRWKLVQCKKPSDLRVFLACLTVHNHNSEK